MHKTRNLFRARTAQKGFRVSVFARFLCASCYRIFILQRSLFLLDVIYLAQPIENCALDSKNKQMQNVKGAAKRSERERCCCDDRMSRIRKAKKGGAKGYDDSGMLSENRRRL